MERVKAGLRNAKAKGKRLGRPARFRRRHENCLSARAGIVLAADRGENALWSGHGVSGAPQAFQKPLAQKPFQNPRPGAGYGELIRGQLPLSKSARNHLRERVVLEKSADGLALVRRSVGNPKLTSHLDTGRCVPAR